MSLARRRVLMLAPFGIAAAGGVAFMAMLNRMSLGKFDPHAIDNPIVGKPIPEFSLPGMGDKQGFSASDLRAAAAGKPILVNFFASWCIPCVSEVETLAALAGEGMAIWGVAYEDKVAKTDEFLGKYGNPYARIAADDTGRVSIDWGIYGVPETFLIDKKGFVRWHVAGPLTDDMVQEELRPALKAIA
jgi:cytochrome c biogenesis protein CcmG/thiol:disulfide interchange protein DsbE